LLGLYTFHCAAQLHPSHPDFLPLCKKAIEKYVQPALKLDKMFPLTCVTIANWFVMTKNRLKDAATVAKRAFELSDVNEIISDGYYHLARKEHIEGNTSSAIKNYEKSDKARGGDQRGYIPAKFGSAQLRVLMGDSLGAKHTLERILQKQPTLEAQILLGTLFAEEVFEAQAENSKEDKSNELKKALKYLEDVAKAWKDPKRNLTPDRWVLLNLARLYEIVDQPDKSLKCLEEVEQLLKAEQPDEDLPPQLLNNMGCFHFQSERYVQARELFQTALNACVKAASKDPTIDTDALVTSISYNLGRTYESEGMLDEAKEVYDNLLKRHANYIDARIRLAYISLRQSPTDEGPRAVGKLMQDHESNLEVRALYGWYLNKSKPRVADVAEDKEQRHYKRTLQGNGGANKHDQYALTGLGNVHLTAAREMRGTAEQDKEKRNKAYAKAAEFYEKVLQVDGKNAYAAQGIAIALIENKKDHATGIQILNKVKETLKDYSVFLNLGHAYCDTQQYPRAIENVSSEPALSMHGS
jgi:RNA polymerase-associated protein CTR9